MPHEFTRDDILYFIVENNVKMINFRYVAEDGRLKKLNFSINSKKHLIEILTFGERVDGSSLFSYVNAESSDLYVIPKFKTAFVNPFSETLTVDILCSFYDFNGNPLESAPENILKKAHENLKKESGISLKALGELEYYVIYEKNKENSIYIAKDQRSYHESAPFTKWSDFRQEALKLISKCGGIVKYAHSEVGNFSDDNYFYEQNEIEFLPQYIEDAADQLIIAKWILRKLAYKYNVEISFAPKISVGKAGSGLHFHLQLEKDKKNITSIDGKLSDISKKAIAGILSISDALTSFGNTIPLSYFRLVPNQEAPTKICWGDRNRSVVVRVPLGFNTKNNMVQNENPQDTTSEYFLNSNKQTFEYRVSDGSCDIYAMLSALTVAVNYGISKLNNSLEIANKLYVNVNIFKEENKKLRENLLNLPFSCFLSAKALEKKREIFEENQIFPKGTIDNYIKKLLSYDDKNLFTEIKEDQKRLEKLVKQNIHCM
jgi:glutamine synthetase